MTDRDPIPTIPDCPLCGSNDEARPLPARQSHLGRYVCLSCMFTYDGTTSEWDGYQAVRDGR